MTKPSPGFSFLGAVSAALATIAFTPVAAHAADGAEDTIEEVVVIGSRRAERSAADAPAPVDVITGEDFTRAAATDAFVQRKRPAHQ